MFKFSLISSLNGVVDLLQKMQVPVMAEKHQWDEAQVNRINTLIDNAQLILRAFTDDLPDKEQFLNLLVTINNTSEQVDWVNIRMVQGNAQSFSIINSVNGVIDLLQINLLPEIAEKNGWDSGKQAIVNTSINNLQKVFVSLTDDISNSEQFLKLADAINEAVSQADWLQVDEDNAG